MIPKVIHYCWFGGAEKPRLAKKCIASWEKNCSGYEIVEWNEENFDVDQHPYLRWCHDHQKWAFLSDFARLLIVKNYGGIYFDTDVELLRNPEELLKYEAFYGFENKNNVATGLGFGAVADHITVNAMVEEYCRFQPDKDGNYPLIVCPAVNTKALLTYGLQLTGLRQNIAGAEILPIDYLNPYDDPTGVLKKSNETISIHWYSKSWMDKKTVLRSKLTKPLHRICGVDCFKGLKK